MYTRFTNFIVRSALAVVLVLGLSPLAFAQKLGVNCLGDGGTQCTDSIPDGSINGAGMLESTVTVPSGSCTSVARVCVAYGVEHSDTTDLSIELSHGVTTQALSFPSSMNPDIHTSQILESEFDGADGSGVWTLRVRDNLNGQFGALNNWTLGLCCGASCGTGLVTASPASGLVTTEAGTTAASDVELTCPPFYEVTIPVSSSDTSEGQSAPTSLVFNSANQANAQTLTATGQDDTLLDGDIAYNAVLGSTSIGAAFNPSNPPDLYNPPSVYQGLDPNDIALVNLDNDVELNINITDNMDRFSGGQTITYTIVATNGSLIAANGATVAASFDAKLQNCTWTCTGASGGICSANGSGNINDSVNLPVGASVTYTASCSVPSNVAPGNLISTAQINGPAGFNEANTANNQANDSDIPEIPTIAPIPTLSGWGLLLFGLLLIIPGGYYYFRRSPIC